MKALQRKGRLFGVVALLLGGGLGMGVLASSLTTDAVVWRPPATIPTTATPTATLIDQASAGRGWARTAFDGGLRDCPKINPEFLAACQTEMKKLSDRPVFLAGSYGGPLLITKIEPDRVDDGWKAQERLETPRAPLEQAAYEPLPEPTPAAPSFEPTSDNYPAMPPAPVIGAGGTEPPIGR
jgi:hypothetical protein